MNDDGNFSEIEPQPQLPLYIDIEDGKSKVIVHDIDKIFRNAGVSNDQVLAHRRNYQEGEAVRQTNAELLIDGDNAIWKGTLHLDQDRLARRYSKGLQLGMFGGNSHSKKTHEGGIVTTHSPDPSKLGVISVAGFSYSVNVGEEYLGKIRQVTAPISYTEVRSDVLTVQCEQSYELNDPDSNPFHYTFAFGKAILFAYKYCNGMKVVKTKNDRRANEHEGTFHPNSILYRTLGGSKPVIPVDPQSVLLFERDYISPNKPDDRLVQPTSSGRYGSGTKDTWT